ncbi:MAG: tRNA lysidine(34) synthetase TilS [Myxococcales bacterium]|jgi:tRNA(Ile)-lysidine synthase|nr:tRNA lysidine(34) synthetase TilS [Myxococcales bacterium]MBL0194804.1 tRNA lysidine(34) synthetase TilS [Myxococcales bacterium]HQY62397.1 tRNA lysidine(34) synthetase TilS [Polyangiaceae bacterium]
MSRGSHAPSLTTLARRALAEVFEDTPGSDRAPVIVCAVSGGPDSIALLHVLSLLAKARGSRVAPFQLTACGVDHGLRHAAAAELALAQGVAEGLGVPFTVREVSVATGANLQARARAARHEALLAEADARGGPNALVATAHHADDRAETFLLRLARGAGLRGLAVLPPRDGRLVRPLIRARRADVLTHLSRHGLPSAEDPSNLDRRFARARVRHDVLPALLALDPRFVEHVCDVCDELAPLRTSLAAPPEGREGLGRRHREALAHMEKRAAAGADATKMALRLPNLRSATYDSSAGRVAIHSASSAPAPHPEPEVSGSSRKLL